jgi:hypothetical protein
MFRQIFILAILYAVAIQLSAQDSSWVKVHPKFNKVSGLHRTFFGENYRKEWAANTKLPLIRISTVEGGLKPLRLGGGHQTLSLRLISPTGEEWVIRSLDKDASILLPPSLRETFARDLLDDAMSAQHPFSPLVVAELAKAADVPQADPVIGIIQEEPALGDFNKQFAGKVCLLEKREPLGKSYNSAEMFSDLNSDNDNNFDSRAFLKASLLDLLIGDWDRHADQWRWVDVKKGKSKLYVGIPRDRDQALYVNQGIFPGLASKPWLVPNLQGFRGHIKQVKYSLLESNFLTSRPASHLSYDVWKSVTDEFVKSITDSVIEKALKKLPASAYELRHEKLSRALKERRDNIPAAMEEFYHFINRIAEVQLSNKHELVNISDTLGDALLVNVSKRTKSGYVDHPIMSAIYYPSITKELRIYTGSGDDSVVINNNSSPIRIRLIGGEGMKEYNVLSAAKNIRVYDKKENAIYSGETNKLKKHRSDDSSNTAYIAANRYNVLKPIITGGFNRDDGFLLGLGFKYTHQGFRKVPYASTNRLVLYHSFATSAFKIKYNGEWLNVFGKTDVIANADIFAPQNTQNFFGRGNETQFYKIGDYKKYYRVRFNFYQFTTALRWRNKNKGIVFSVGPSLQYYLLDNSKNIGRIITDGVRINSYDSTSLTKSKTHLGVVMNFTVDKRNTTVIPSHGYYFNVRMQGFGGLNNYAKSYGQLIPEFAVYLKLNPKASIILADRVGGGVTAGKSAFYQSLFVGGHENLLGYRQYRFAGESMLYNNFEARIRIANFTGYIIPGQFGIIGFYDVGRVWIKGENSNIWHNGSGGGFYFAPAQLMVVSLVAGYSKEGWYPYITLGFRF